MNEPILNCWGESARVRSVYQQFSPQKRHNMFNILTTCSLNWGAPLLIIWILHSHTWYRYFYLSAVLQQCHCSLLRAEYNTNIIQALCHVWRKPLRNVYLMNTYVRMTVSGKGLQLSLSKNKMGGWQFAIILLWYDKMRFSNHKKLKYQIAHLPWVIAFSVSKNCCSFLCDHLSQMPSDQPICHYSDTAQ